MSRPEHAGTADPGYFGPDSVTWMVNREMAVLFGGARALLMHAAHPLVAAGARQTGGYERNPWKRLIRTLQLQNMVTFGTKAEAREAADRINKLHEIVNGVDEVTGKRYDALDPELLLWVHAALEVCSLYFFERTVRPLTGAEKQAYHEENLVAAELLLLDRADVPDTIEELEAYVENMAASGPLQQTDVSDRVAHIIRSGPVPFAIKPIWGFISFAAFGTLPEPLRTLYGVRWTPAKQRLLDANLTALRTIRPVLPRRLRLIGPARWAEERLESNPSLTPLEAGRRRRD